MEPDEAARILGVQPGSDPVEVRAAYVERIRAVHPDLAGASATATAALVTEAYSVMQHVVRPPRSARQDAGQPQTPLARPSPDRSEVGPPSDLVTLVDDDTVAFSFPADEVFPLLVDVADDLGEITYLDVDNGLIEALVAFQGEPVCSVVLSLQGRSDQVEAFCTIEALDGSRPPPTADVVELIFRQLRARLTAR